MLWSHKLTTESVASGQHRCGRPPSSMCALVNIFCKDERPRAKPAPSRTPKPTSKMTTGGPGPQAWWEGHPARGSAPAHPGGAAPTDVNVRFHWKSLRVRQSPFFRTWKAYRFLQFICVRDGDFPRTPEESGGDDSCAGLTRTARPGRCRSPSGPAALTQHPSAPLGGPRFRAAGAEERARHPWLRRVQSGFKRMLGRRESSVLYFIYFLKFLTPNPVVVVNWVLVWPLHLPTSYTQNIWGHFWLLQLGSLAGIQC